MIDFDPTTPGDSDIVANYPANERAERQKVQDWTEADHYEVDGRHRVVHLKDQGGDPITPPAGQIAVYSKLVGGKANIFIKDEDGNVIQLTQGGAIDLASLLVATLTVSGASNLQGLLTLDAHLKTSLATLDILGSGNEVGARLTRNSPTDFLLQVLTGGVLRDVFNAKQVHNKNWTAVGKGVFWDTDVDLTPSLVATWQGGPPANINIRGNFVQLPMMQFCWGYIEFDSFNPTTGTNEISFDYPIAFFSPPSVHIDLDLDTVSRGFEAGWWTKRHDAASATKLFARVRQSASVDEEWRGFSFIAMGFE